MIENGWYDSDLVRDWTNAADEVDGRTVWDLNRFQRALSNGHDGLTFGTLTWSFSGPAGRKRITVAMTGRQLAANPPDAPAMQDFVHDALAPNCRGDAVRWPELSHDTAIRPILK